MGYIVAISGKCGSGKNIFCKFLLKSIFDILERSCRSIPITQMAYADALKRLLALYTGKKVEDINTESGKNLIHDGAVNEHVTLEDVGKALFPILHNNGEDIRDLLFSIYPHMTEHNEEANNFMMHSFRKCMELTKNACMQKLSYGELLQKIGTDIWRDKLDDNIWFKIAMRNAGDYPGIVIITDLRFRNEAQFEDGYKIRINRVNLNFTTRDRNHPSEVDLDSYDGFDKIINNDSDLDSFKNIAKETASEIINLYLVSQNTS